MSRDEKLKEAFKKIKTELDDHLQSINENTNEIQANFEYNIKLEEKIEKLNEKLEELMIIKPKKEHKKIKLTLREQEVFLILYTTNDYVNYAQIARKLGFTTQLTSSYCTNLIEKGIPILKRYVNKQAQVKLDPGFKELQAKENLINIDRRVADSVK